MKTSFLQNLILLCILSIVPHLAKPQGFGIGVAAPAGQLDVLGVASWPVAIFNDNGVDADFRIEGDGDASLFMLDASVDRIGFGLTAPQAKLDINSTVTADVILSVQGTAAQSGDFFEIQNSGGNDVITVSANAGALGGVVINEQGSDADVRIEGDTDVDLFHSDASTDRVGIGVTAAQAKLDVVNTADANVILSAQGTAAQSGDFFEIQNSGGNDVITVSANAGALGGVVINEQGSDADVRIEGDTDVDLFHSDASTDRVGIGVTAAQAKLDVVNTSDANVILSAQGTAAQASDFFEIQNSGGSDLITVSSNAGALGGVVINEQGSDADVRIESDGNTHMFFLDASTDYIGIGTQTGASTTPARKLDVRGTIIGALPVFSADCARVDDDSNDDEVVCLMAAAVPSTKRVWVIATDGSNTRQMNVHDTRANWDQAAAWSDFGDPSAGNNTGYIMDISVVCLKGENRDSGDDEYVGMIVVRFSDGNIYVTVSNDPNNSYADLDNYGGKWDAWGGATPFDAGPGM